MMHEIYIKESIPVCRNWNWRVKEYAFYYFEGCTSCCGEDDCIDFDYVDTPYTESCSRIGYKQKITKKLCKQFEYDADEGISIGSTHHEIGWIETLIIDGEYIVGKDEADA